MTVVVAEPAAVAAVVAGTGQVQLTALVSGKFLEPGMKGISSDDWTAPPFLLTGLFLRPLGGLGGWQGQLTASRRMSAIGYQSLLILRELGQGIRDCAGCLPAL